MPECEGCRKDVKRITKYEKTGQWLCETCVADLEEPQAQEPRTSMTNGTCEITAPASGILAFLPYEEGDSVGSEDVLATIDTQ